MHEEQGKPWKQEKVAVKTFELAHKFNKKLKSAPLPLKYISTNSVLKFTVEPAAVKEQKGKTCA